MAIFSEILFSNSGVILSRRIFYGKFFSFYASTDKQIGKTQNENTKYNTNYKAISTTPPSGWHTFSPFFTCPEMYWSEGIRINIHEAK
jgi:hypothetical protein